MSWRKPILFSFSFGITSASLAWVMTFLPGRPAAGWALASSFGVAAVAEVFLISLQRWLGVASHFNTDTWFDSIVFIVMGVMIGVAAVGIVALTCWSLVSLRAPRSIAVAIWVGLILLLVGQALGGAILREGFQQKGDGRAPASPVIQGDDGVMNAPHALGLHAVQVLPFLAWLLSFGLWQERARVRVVVAGAAGYAAVFAGSLVQTFRGDAPLEVGVVTGLLFGAGLIVLGVAFGRAGLGLQRARA